MTILLKIHIRAATIQDKDFIISLIPRLIEFGPPLWRNPNEMIQVDEQILTEKLISNPPGTFILIAEDDDNVPLGFIHLQTGTDYYNKVKHGHISDIIISPEAEGRGIGKLLIEKAEEWARSQDFHWLTLSVFSQNNRARELYSKLGYGEDIIKYVKKLL